jgi:uncharacterized protein (TIGR01244 family)
MRRNLITRLRALTVLLVLPVLVPAAFAQGGGTTGNDPGTGEGRQSNAPAPRVEDSQGPIVISGVDIGNFGVVDGHIFRGEEPDDEDYAALAKLGVKTVIDLRREAGDASRALAERAGLRYVNIPMEPKAEPTDAEVAKFLEAVNDRANGPVYVHCAGGRHRTGSLVAVYRMVTNGWPVDKAYEEMKAYDFYTRFGHKGYKTYVFDYYSRMKADPSSVPACYEPSGASAQR